MFRPHAEMTEGKGALGRSPGWEGGAKHILREVVAVVTLVMATH